MAGAKRLHLKNFLPDSVCRELEFIHKSCGVAGYRPSVLSTTLLHLIATNCSPLIIPFIHIREKVKEVIEEQYGCEFKLFLEFTGLISWTKGAKIGWHSDNDRPYLKQRHFTAVCYLNSHEEDFKGGLFHFKDGSPATIVPHRGDVLIYRAEDIHCVDEVMNGERCTLALWFTLDNSYDEDVKLIEGLASVPAILKPSDGAIGKSSIYTKSWIPLSACCSMYVLNVGDETESKYRDLTGRHQRDLESDIRIARFADLDFYFTSDTAAECSSTITRESTDQYKGRLEISGHESIQDALENPIKLHLDRHGLSYTFANSVHALQVLFFSEWINYKADLTTATTAVEENILSHRIVKRIREDSTQISHTACIKGGGDGNINSYASTSIVLSASGDSLRALLVEEWEQYITAHGDYLLKCYPEWKSLRSLSAIAL